MYYLNYLFACKVTKIQAITKLFWENLNLSWKKFGKYLAEFMLRHRKIIAVSIKNDGPRAGSPLIQG